MAERTYEYRERTMPTEDVVERRRVDDPYERARGQVEDPYEPIRARARDAKEHSRYKMNEMEDMARDTAAHARGRMAEMGERVRDTVGYARDRMGDVGERVREAPEYVGDRVRDAAGYVRDKASEATGYTQGRAEETKGYTREKTGDMSERARATAGHARSRAEELGAHARERLGELGEHTRERLEELTETARARMEDVKERVKETVSATAGYGAGGGGHHDHKVGENWHRNTEAAKNLADKEYCLPLPTDRLCMRHVVFLVPLLLAIGLWFFRRRNPDKWRAGMQKLNQKKEYVENTMKNARDTAVETLRKEREAAAHKASRAGNDISGSGSSTHVHAAERAGQHVDRTAERMSQRTGEYMEHAGKRAERAGEYMEGTKKGN